MRRCSRSASRSPTSIPPHSRFVSLGVSQRRARTMLTMPEPRVVQIHFTSSAAVLQKGAAMLEGSASSRLPILASNTSSSGAFVSGVRGALTGTAPPMPARARHGTAAKNWSTGFYDCCCAVTPMYCCLVTWCPCTTTALVRERLGGRYESALLCFGVLAFGAVMCFGFALSSSSDEPVHDTEDDRRPEFGRLPRTPEPTQAARSNGVSTTFLWEFAAFVLLTLFLLGVWRLRFKTRRTLEIEGTALMDCILSFFCCFCVISQLQLELSQHEQTQPADQQSQYRRHRGSNGGEACRIDTLPPYATAV